MVDETRNTVFVRDGEANVREASAQGGVQEVRSYVLRAETGVYTGLLSGERDTDRVQGPTDEQGSDETNSSQESQS